MIPGHDDAQFDGAPFVVFSANAVTVTSVVPLWKLLSSSLSSTSLSMPPPFCCDCIARQRGDARGALLIFNGEYIQLLHALL